MGTMRKTTGPTRRQALASLLGALALLVLPPALARGGAETPTTTLTVVVEGLASDAGSVALALYDSRDAYRDEAEPVRKSRQGIADGACTWVVEDLPPGDYALSAYHDANGNGELDKGAFGIPTEPYGFSNDARSKTGRPGWDKVRFSVIAPEAELRVRVH